jgi:hypothetical protein
LIKEDKITKVFQRKITIKKRFYYENRVKPKKEEGRSMITDQKEEDKKIRE